ncbi:MAG: GNAT family N-acetyltransferase [Victivallaceae bacterium]
METLILPAAESDAGVMALLYVSSWRSAYTGIVPDDYLKLKLSGAEEKFKHLLAESPLGHYLILSGGTPAGILSAGELADQYELRGLYIHPEFQRCGVGRSAVEFVFALWVERVVFHGFACVFWKRIRGRGDSTVAVVLPNQVLPVFTMAATICCVNG